MAQFTARTMPVEKLFGNPFFIGAPSYQRAFVWSADEAGQLLRDIAAALEAAGESREEGEYFLGAMLFIDPNPPPSRLRRWTRRRPEASRQLDVVDGFQRLTTLTILFCVLRDLAAGEHEPPSPRLLAAIRAGEGPGARDRLTVGGTEEAFFLGHVRAPGATLADQGSGAASLAEERMLEVRNHFVSELAAYDAKERRQLAEFVLKHCYVVHVTTTGIDRAHRIFEVLNARGKPLARNDILKAMLLGSVPMAGIASCRTVWKEAETRLGGEFEQLFSHIRAMYRRTSDRVISDLAEIAAAKGGAQPFIEQVLGPAAAVYQNIRAARHVGSPHSAAICQYLRYLNWHGFSDWIPPVMLWWLEHGEDSEGLARLLARLDRLAFAARILCMGTSKRVRRFGAVAAALREGRRLDAPDSPLELSRSELRTIQYNLRDLHGRNAQAAKHLLMRLCDGMAGSPQSATFPGDMTVEHVLPRKLGAGSPWRPWYTDPAEREWCTESLGNLVLVTKSQNMLAANLDFARKLELYFGTPGAPVPAVNEGLRGLHEWRAEHIRAREAQLMRAIDALWSFDLARSREPRRAEAVS